MLAVAKRSNPSLSTRPQPPQFAPATLSLGSFALSLAPRLLAKSNTWCSRSDVCSSNAMTEGQQR
jgi:hypothetical protein